MSLQVMSAQREDLSKILDLQKESYLSEAEMYNEYKIPSTG